VASEEPPPSPPPFPLYFSFPPSSVKLSSPTAAIAASKAANTPIAFQHLYFTKHTMLVVVVHFIAHVNAVTAVALDPGGGGAPVLLLCTGARLYCVELVEKETSWESVVPPCGEQIIHNVGVVTGFRFRC